MNELVSIILSGLLLYVIGYPLVEWVYKIKDEMEEKKNGLK